MYGSANPLAFMELQDVQELSNFFERRVSAYQVGVSGVGRRSTTTSDPRMTGGVSDVQKSHPGGGLRGPGQGGRDFGRPTRWASRASTQRT